MKLTSRQKQVLDALTNEFESGYTIARLAVIATASPKETASRFCIQLVKLGLAEKGGTPMFPKWRRSPAAPASASGASGE